MQGVVSRDCASGDDMALSIKNEEVEQLVRRISAETGEGITETIRTALEEHFEKIRRAKRGPNLFDEIRAISKRCAALCAIFLDEPEAEHFTRIATGDAGARELDLLLYKAEAGFFEGEKSLAILPNPVWLRYYTINYQSS